MDYGDFKLLAALGAWFGVDAPPLLLLSSELKLSSVLPGSQGSAPCLSETAPLAVDCRHHFKPSFDHLFNKAQLEGMKCVQCVSVNPANYFDRRRAR